MERWRRGAAIGIVDRPAAGLVSVLGVLSSAATKGIDCWGQIGLWRLPGPVLVTRHIVEPTGLVSSLESSWVPNNIGLAVRKTLGSNG